MNTWIAISPELVFILTSAVFFIRAMMPASGPGQNHMTGLILSAVGVGVSLACIYATGDFFFEVYRVDLFSQVFKVLLAMGFFLVLCLCGNLDGVDERRHPEFYFLLSTCTLAMMMLVSGVNLLVIYLALEISSYSLYILVYLRRQKPLGTRAAVTYFLVGASASATMLMGIGLLYSQTGNTALIGLLRTLPGILSHPLVALGLLLTLCGFFFKLGLFPFHFWIADVYAGAPHQVAAYIATVSKVAAIAVLIRMLSITGGNSPFIIHSLAALAIVSMTIGNLMAIVQKDFKRLLAFSSIAHAGYVMIGILCMTASGYTGAIFYAMALLVMKFACFLVVVVVAAGGGNPEVAHLAGLHRRAPVLALMLMVALFGLAGIPPTIGFTGKLLLFTAAMENGYFSLIIIAMINVVISLYYYLLVLKAAYLTEPEDAAAPLAVPHHIQALAGALIAVMVIGGIYPRYLIALARAAARLLG